MPSVINYFITDWDRSRQANDPGVTWDAGPTSSYAGPFTANEAGYTLYVLSESDADPANYINSKSGSKVQRVESTGAGSAFYVFTPTSASSGYDPTLGGFVPRAYYFSNLTDLQANILKVPKENGTLAYTSTNSWENGSPSSIGQILATVSSSILMADNGTFPFPTGSFPKQ